MTATKITRTAPRACAYTVGQAVEVLGCDFATPGRPQVWFAGTVTKAVQDEDGLWNVMVVREDGAFAPQIVGKRGGNSRMRAVAA